MQTLPTLQAHNQVQEQLFSNLCRLNVTTYLKMSIDEQIEMIVISLSKTVMEMGDKKVYFRRCK